MIDIVYFSSISENTKRFIEKLGFPAKRIPLRPRIEGKLLVDTDYILILPTYGGGYLAGAVPKPVITFLNNPQNRKHIRGVISSGNTNFGNAFCIAGKIIAQKCNIPELYKFELLGTNKDVINVRNIINNFKK